MGIDRPIGAAIDAAEKIGEGMENMAAKGLDATVDTASKAEGSFANLFEGATDTGSRALDTAPGRSFDTLFEQPGEVVEGVTQRGPSFHPDANEPGAEVRAMTIEQAEQGAMSSLEAARQTMSLAEAESISAAIGEMAEGVQRRHAQYEAEATLRRDELREVTKYLDKNTPEGFGKADKVSADHVLREMTEQLHETFNTPGADTEIPWEAKQKLLEVSQTAELIRGDDKPQKTLRLLEQQKTLDKAYERLGLNRDSRRELPRNAGQ